MNKKRLWFVSFLLLLCLSAFFAACAKDNTDEKDQTVAAESIAISNESDLTAEWTLGEADRTVHVTFTPDTFTEENTQFTVESSNTSVITVNGNSIKAVGAGTSTVTVRAGEASDSVEITVAIGIPTVTVEGAAQAVAGSDLDVRDLVLAEACDGTDISERVQVSFDDDKITYDQETGTVRFAEKGTYELTVWVSDPRDESKTASGTLTVNVARNPFSAMNQNFRLTNLYGEESEQTATVSSDEYAFAVYDAEPSKLYYAEATFTVQHPHAGVQVGLGSFIEGNMTRMIVAGVDRGDLNFKIKDIDLVKTPDVSFNEWQAGTYNDVHQPMYIYRLAQYRGLQLTNNQPVKFAVAREGDFFYFFVDDMYVAGIVFNYYRNIDTIPGIAGMMLSSTSVSGMNWLGGAEAQEKIDTLIGNGQQISPYVPDGSWASGSLTNFKDVTDIKEDESGISFKYTSTANNMNSSMISPYLYFEGDFQVEWVYKCTETAAGAGRMYLELRDWRYGSPVLNLGERHSDNKFLLDILPESKTDADLYQPEFGDFDFSQGARYTMVRTLTEDHAVYVLTVTSVANPEQTFTRTINYAEERWNEPVLFHWKNEAIAGEYSCIRWESFDADEVTEPISVSISNKSELTQEWILGKADRTVSVSFMPDSFNEQNVEFTVTSDNPDVVSVSGKTLHAAAAGKATITVTVTLEEGGTLTDSVEIIVATDVPTGIQISNESELTAAWVAGDPERRVHVTFTPDKFTEENAQFTVTSGNPEVVDVNGKNLIAVGAGTAIITVTAGNATDTIEITVDRSAPVIELTEDGTPFTEGDGYFVIEVLEGTAVKQPIATVTSCENKDISADADIVVSDEKYDAETGITSYTITYTAADPVESTLTSSVQVNVYIYRKIIDLDDATYSVTDPYVANADQVVKSTSKGYTVARFNMDPSTLYYAEVTYTVENPNGSILVGMGHFTDESNLSRWLATAVDRGDRNFKFRDFNTADGWYMDESQGVVPWSWQIKNYRGIADDDAGKVTFAIARAGDYFYSFINGEYVGSITYEYYRDNETVPGLFGNNLSTSTMTNIVYISGVEAQEKIDSLIGKGQMIGPYVPDGSWAGGSLTNFGAVANVAEDENGIRFKYTSTGNNMNASMVSPYVIFDGDFKVEWVYKSTDTAAGAGRMYLDLRDWKYGSPILNLGERHSDNKFLLDRQPETADAQVPENKWYQPAFGDFDFSQGTRYTLTRTLTENYAVYVLTLTSVANPEQTFTRTINYGEARWNEPVLFHWKNEFIAGEYSQIKWEISDAVTAE